MCFVPEDSGHPRTRDCIWERSSDSIYASRQVLARMKDTVLALSMIFWFCKTLIFTIISFSSSYILFCNVLRIGHKGAIPECFNTIIHTKGGRFRR